MNMSDNRCSFSHIRHLYLPNFIPPILVAYRLPLLWRFLAFSIYTALFANALNCTTGDLQEDYAAGAVASALFFYAGALVWILDPIKNYRRDGDPVCPEDMNSMKRLLWAIVVFVNPRGIGWNYQIPNVPPRSKLSRWPFVARQAFRSVAFFFLFDLCATYLSHHPTLIQIRDKSLTGKDIPTVIPQGFLDFKYLLLVLAFGVRIIADCSMTHASLSIASVTLGLSQPDEWPDMFGSLWDLRSLRHFWGAFWHQSLRQFFVAYGLLATRILRLRKGSRSSASTQIALAFVISALIHATGDFVAAWPARNPFLQSAPFFVVQIAGIAFEDALGLHRMGRMIGCLWMITWFCAVMPLWGHALAWAGNMKPRGYSLVRWVGLDVAIRRWLSQD